MQRISEVMNNYVQTISPVGTIEEAAQEMRDGDFGVLPVGATDNLMEIITDRDIVVCAVAEGMGVNTKVKDAMSDEVIFVNEDDSIEDAAQLMSDYQIRRLPVLDTDGRPMEIVSL